LTSLCGSSTPPTLGDVAIGRGFDGRQRLIVVAVTVVLVTALALILAVRGYNTLLEETFYDRSVAYVQAFAASAEAWVEPLNVEMLRSAARFMLVGSALFVQIEIAGDLVIDEREETDALGSPTDPSPSSSAGKALRLPSGRTYLDVSAPLSVWSEAVGSVRMGIDTTSIVVRGRSMALTGTGVAIGVDALVLVLLFWSHRGRARKEEGVGYASQGTVPAPIVVGDLRIDQATKRVTLKGKEVELTPKQFALLEFLAQRLDRVVSEQEIVNGVWAGSHYADSKDVKQYVYLVRKRLAKADPGGRDLIATVPGFGYRLTSDSDDGELTDG